MSDEHGRHSMHDDNDGTSANDETADNDVSYTSFESVEDVDDDEDSDRAITTTSRKVSRSAKGGARASHSSDEDAEELEFFNEPSPDEFKRHDPQPKKTHYKALIITFIVILLVVVGVGGWFLWGKDYVTQRVVEKTVTQQLNQIKAGDVSAIVDNTQDSVTFFDDYDIDETAFYQAYFEGFDYTLDKVTVKGDFIDIQCTLTTKDVKKVFTDTVKQVVSLSTVSSFISSGDNDLNKSIGESILTGVQDSDQYSTNTVHIRLVKEDGQWKLDNATEIITVLLTGDDVGVAATDTLNAVTDGLASIGTSISEVAQSLSNTLSTISGVTAGATTTTGSSKSS